MGDETKLTLIDDRTKKQLFPIELDIMTGNFIMRHAYSTNWPDKIEKRTFVPNVRKTMTKKFIALYKCLKAVSDIVKEEKSLYFGPRKQYEVQQLLPDQISDDETNMAGEIVSKRYLMIDKTFKVKVNLTEAGKDGLYWLLYLFLHPASKMVLSPGMQEEMAFPLAEQIMALAGLQKITGGESKESIEPTYDDDMDDSTPTEIGVETKGEDAE